MSDASLVQRDALASARPRDGANPAGDRGRRAIVVCDQWLGSNGYAGMKALRRAGWSVRVVPEWELIPLHWRGLGMRVVGRLLRHAAVREFNAALVRAARELEPELFLAFKGTFVDETALDALRGLGVRTYCFYPDVSFRTHGPYLPRALPRYDWVFTTKTFGLRDLREQLGVTRASVLLHAYDPDLHRPIELSPSDRTRYACDVSFIGTWSPKKEMLLRAIVERRPSIRLRVWGEQWDRVGPGSPLRAVIGGRGVHGEEYVRAIAGSAVNLAILSEQRPGASSGDQITSRTFHIPACGGFMLHERTAELLALFAEGESVACYRDVDELIAQLDRYLAVPEQRDAIAARGRAVVAAGHSWDHRIREILAQHEALSR
ncbi:MAG: glycosyltransferase [Gemmatimonadaceae bacterium]|nr:glycosyltransferase [Gemmatimonadaceae bacterium]